MTNEEYVELLQHLSERVRAAGLASLDEAVLADLRLDDPSPLGRLLAYLQALDAELSLRSSATVKRALTELNGFASAERGERIDGLLLRLEPVDADRIGASTIDLGDLPDLDPLRQDIRHLMDELRAAR